jgi:hypothetical protein
VSHQSGDPETKGLWRKRFDDTKDQTCLYKRKICTFSGDLFSMRAQAASQFNPVSVRGLLWLF